ncbi:MAG: hypothetical protein ING98_12045 [Rhodocyclaceae bacterium]|nr:hypothetical protein [Rhodocyclaceae bacterium]MCA3098056.1 hypothetical protein [Rhodocyclaceae bacterium]MCA3102599.1 hypothetical protein [Rhodocyclaceae bacterium]MCA3112105.1 hypothetical protein [Rhodocyclaceae bacterium]MCA3114676.1 hypothetical protein [Rhodocyclaceae bacterium]
MPSARLVSRLLGWAIAVGFGLAFFVGAPVWLFVWPAVAWLAVNLRAVAVIVLAALGVALT